MMANDYNVSKQVRLAQIGEELYTRLPKGIAIQLLSNPNPGDNQQSLLEKLDNDLQKHGKAYLWVRATSRGTPTELRHLPFEGVSTDERVLPVYLEFHHEAGSMTLPSTEFIVLERLVPLEPVLEVEEVEPEKEVDDRMSAKICRELDFLKEQYSQTSMTELKVAIINARVALLAMLKSVPGQDD